jgi:hypothetical protein
MAMLVFPVFPSPDVLMNYSDIRTDKTQQNDPGPAGTLQEKKLMSGFFVDFFRIKDFGSYNIALQGAVEAGHISGMAGSPGLFNPVNQAVLIAVGKDLRNVLEMAALLSLLPEFLPAPAVIVGKTRFLRQPDGFFVRICHHEHFIAQLILHNDRDEPVLEFKVQHGIHFLKKYCS